VNRIKQAQGSRNRGATPRELARYFAMKLAAEWGPYNLKARLDDPAYFVLDVRSQEGYREGHIPGAYHIPLDELPLRLKEVPKAKTIVAYCGNVTCLLCTKAAHLLASKGYRVRELVGGIAEWQAAGFPVEH